VTVLQVTRCCWRLVKCLNVGVAKPLGVSCRVKLYDCAAGYKVLSVASQPIDKGGQSPRVPKVLGAPSNVAKKIQHGCIT